MSTLAWVSGPVGRIRDGARALTARELASGVVASFRKHDLLVVSAAMAFRVLLALIPVATTVPALATLAGVNVLLWAVITYETIVVYDERRYRLRHGLDPDSPSSLGGERA